MRPIVFLDFDDVICLNRNYGGYDVFSPDPPDELWPQLFHPPAITVLQELVNEFGPSFVLTTSWLRLMDRERCDALLERCGLEFVSEGLHVHWEAPPVSGRTRLDAIEGWLQAHHRGEPFVIIDDVLSGTELRESRFHAEGRVVLCDVNEGLHHGFLPGLRNALTNLSEG